MLPFRQTQLSHKKPAQALVEFSLTAMVLLLVLTMVIEVARVMQAYVTLQHAVSDGARYAVTGQWDAQYAGDSNLTAGWTAGSSIPLQHIPPCWSRFYDDPYAPVPAGPLFYEPYRDPRTCSVEATVARGLTGLNLDANANIAAQQVDAYEIVVSGYSSDSTPTSGAFRRRGSVGGVFEDVAYSDYYNYGGVTGDTPGLVRGFAGDPGQKVVVQVRYQFALITPILSRIVPTLQLQAAAVMTNETFGGTGVQSTAVLPPPLPEVPPLNDPIPPDLIVPAGGIQLVTLIPPNPIPGQTVDFNVTVGNQGQLNTVTNCVLSLYASTTPISPLQPPIPGGARLIGTATVPPIVAGDMASTVVPVTTTFSAGGVYYIYAYVDDGNAIDETGAGGVADPNRELNNVTDFSSTIQVNSIADLGVTKVVDNATPLEGATIHYTVAIQNFGPNDATSVTITDNLPTQLTYVSAAPSQGTYSGGVWTVGTITNGSTVTLVITATVNAGTSGQLVTNATTALTMSSTINDPNISNDAASVQLRVNAVDLAMSKVVNNSNPGVGQTVIYTLTIQNLSTTTDATNVQVTDPLPSQVTYVSAAPSQGTCSQAAGTVTCSLGTINLSSSATVAISATINTGTSGVVVSNTASVSSSQADLNAANNSGSALLTVQSSDIQITKTASVSQIAEQVNFTYTITAQNVGTSPVTGIAVTDSLPAGLTYVSSNPSSGTTYNSGTGNWSIGNLAVGAQATLTITVKANTGTNNTNKTNTASLNTAGISPADINASNDSSSVTVGINNANTANLGLQKSVSPTTVNPNTNVVYTLTLTNNGPVAATGIVVTDATLSSAVSTNAAQFVSSTPSAGSFNIGNGQWSIPNLANGAVATLQITLKIIGNGSPSFTNTASITASSPSDPVSGNNSASATLTINWPASLFINAGDPSNASCNTSLSWGSSDSTLGQNYTWVPSQSYTSGSWGIYGSNYSPQAPPSGYSFIGPAPSNTVLPTAGQNLMGCAIRGNSFYYRFDNRLPGLYNIFLVFADPYYDPIKRRFSVDASSTSGRGSSLLRGFDIAQAITLAQSGLPNRILGSPTQVHYIIQTFTYRVTNSGVLRLRFSRGRSGGGYIDTNALLSGIGLTYAGP